ncbi:MAG: hypothetical protein QNJ46_10960 [Leptolyngbyaceae cyanobacterium MO_188.B28]|nr:hypothetical protein [Leptolyngbyaceae cyanobacterium MO_188.B28]
MNRLLLSSVAILLMAAIASPAAFAKTQTDFSDLAADANGDGKVTLSELKRYNRDVRNR